MKKHSLLPLLTVLSLAACSQAPQDDGTGPIKLGYLGPLTGNIASVGNDALHGAQLAIREVNEAGGISGRTVELVTGDTKCAAAEAAGETQKMTSVDKVVAIVGAGCSSGTLGAAPIAEDAGVVMMSYGSSSPDVSDAGDYIFRNYPNDALKTTAMANYIANGGYEKVAIVGSTSDFSVAFRESLLSKTDTEIVFDEAVDQDTTDFRSLVTRLKEVEHDLIVVNISSDAGQGSFLKQAREQGIDTQGISHDYGDTPAVADIGGEATEGFEAINVPSIGEETAFAQSFKAEFGEPQAAYAWAAYGYDSASVLMQAITESGTQGSAIRDYLYGMTPYEGAVGTFSFDRNGDVIGIPYVLKRYEDGVAVKVKDIVVD